MKVFFIIKIKKRNRESNAFFRFQIQRFSEKAAIYSFSPIQLVAHLIKHNVYKKLLRLKEKIIKYYSKEDIFFNSFFLIKLTLH